jgi:shikimate kinase
VPPIPANLVLIGLRGSGKSTLGRAVARATAMTFVDLDTLTPGVLGRADVREAFSRDGEAAFRDAEVAALRAVLKKDHQVVALGGGTPTARGAVDMLSRERTAGRAAIVYLRAEPETLRLRLAADDNTQRPSLTGAGVLDEIEAVMSRRDPMYLALADEVLNVEEFTQDALVRRLAEIAAGGLE